jgi:hypothetical protein
MAICGTHLKQYALNKQKKKLHVFQLLKKKMCQIGNILKTSSTNTIFSYISNHIKRLNSFNKAFNNVLLPLKTQSIQYPKI